MKGFGYTYYLLTLICIAFSSCNGDDIINREMENKIRISLTMNLSGTRTEGSVANTYDYPEERYIKDVTVYIFSKSDEFIEKLANPFMTGSDGDIDRTIIGELEADYSPYTAGIDVIVLTNLAERGITGPTLSKGQTKAELYSQLAYQYTPGDAWQFSTASKRYIPMWGTASISTAIKIGLNQGGNISLLRAVARVDVQLNEGKGFSHFTPTNLKVSYYNDKGYCATNDLNTPYIPENSNIATGAIFFQPNANEAIYRLYIPEYKNNNVSSICKIELTGTLATASGPVVKNKTYTLDFQKEGEAQQDILRNHLYRFNITKIADEVTVTSSLDYDVEIWDPISVDVPVFN